MKEEEGRGDAQWSLLGNMAACLLLCAAVTITRAIFVVPTVVQPFEL